MTLQDLGDHVNCSREFVPQKTFPVEKTVLFEQISLFLEELGLHFYTGTNLGILYQFFESLELPNDNLVVSRHWFSMKSYNTRVEYQRVSIGNGHLSATEL